MSERLRYPELAPEGVASMRGLEHYLNTTTALPAVLLELVRLRASLLNGCEFCIGHHTRELAKHNEPETRVAALGDWASSDAFTPRERAALAWTEAVTNIQDGHASNAAYEAVSVFFEGKDLVDLTLAIASINTWNRMSIAFAARWDPPRKNGNGQHDGKAQHDIPLPPGQTPRAAPAPQAAGAEEPIETAVVDDDGGKVAHD